MSFEGWGCLPKQSHAKCQHNCWGSCFVITPTQIGDLGVVFILGFISISLAMSEMYVVALLVLQSIEYVNKKYEKYRDYLEFF